MENKIAKKKSFLNDTFLFSVLSVVLGLLVGAIALMLSGHNPITVYAALIDGIIGKPKYSVDYNKSYTINTYRFINCICI